MPTLRPFKAWRYDTTKVDMAKVVAPPYDIISAKDQRAFYQRDPHNIIRIILGLEEQGDHEADNKYTRASAFWNRVMTEGIVKQDSVPGFYLYETLLPHPETQREIKRIVLFGALQVEPYEKGIILRHEKTHGTAKQDRFRLLDATRTNFSAIYGMYKDGKQTVNKFYDALKETAPLFSFKLESGDRHRIWQVNDPKGVQELADMFSSKQMVIADGHHRYETALEFSLAEKNRRGADVSPSLNFVLAGLIEEQDEGLIIFPIHRMIFGLKPFDRDAFVKKLEKLFMVKPVSRDALKKLAGGAESSDFGIVFQDASCVRVQAKDETKLISMMPKGKPKTWYTLAVSQIASLILPILNIDEHNIEQHVRYTQSFDQACQQAIGREAELSLIVPPISAGAIHAVCETGEVMPQKSTYFYPKLGSGFVMHRHE